MVGGEAEIAFPLTSSVPTLSLPSERNRLRRGTLAAAARNSLKQFARKLGVHIARHSVRNDPALRRVLLLEWLGVDIMFDVGANVGQYALELRREGYAGRIASFEPQAGPYEELSEAAAKDELWSVHHVGLGDRQRGAEINVSPQSGASSLLGIDGNHVVMHPESAYVGTETIRLELGDAVADELIGETSTVGIKLDVQGFEMNVLAGAPRLLSRAVYVECELLLEHLYDGQAEADELIARFYEAGLRLAGTEPGYVHPETGCVEWMDATFVRDAAQSTA
jgi:FkbM family methyltransferase